MKLTYLCDRKVFTYLANNGIVRIMTDDFNTKGHFSYQLSVISYQYLCLFAQHSAGKSEA
ncbi:MAG: hypothetical protein F6K17_24445 [Okeania sp. SIO3C4]|nr:hypothetical protein [Okeania sp. SIO3B3]NER05511.1 hypothetical protein [Okeania sp. SIO3C4]